VLSRKKFCHHALIPIERSSHRDCQASERTRCFRADHRDRRASCNVSPLQPFAAEQPTAQNRNFTSRKWFVNKKLFGVPSIRSSGFGPEHLHVHDKVQTQKPFPELFQGPLFTRKNLHSDEPPRCNEVRLNLDYMKRAAPPL
jgi:hypothetical protein